MARNEQPLERDGSPVRELAYWLRDARNQSGLTVDQLKSRTGYSNSTLYDAFSGKRLPTRQVTLAIVQACDEDVDAWRTYWAQVRRATDRDVPEADRKLVIPPWAEPIMTRSGEVAGGQTVESEHAATAPGEARTTRRRLLTWGLPAIVVAAGVLITMLVLNGSSPPSTMFPSPDHHPREPAIRTSTRTYTEQEFNRNGAPTFLYLDASGAGIPVAYGQYVQVSCKEYSRILKSTWPDGYWYRLASMPWDNHYYAVANTFGNGDKLAGPYSHNTDWKVPNC